MKRIFQVFLLSAIFTTNAFAQFTLTTTYAGGNGQAGNMFNVTALADIIITSFDGNFDVGGPYTARIYYKTGSYVGSETIASDWTLLGDSAPFTATVTNAATAIPLPLSLSLAPGNYAFYVTLVASTALNYTNGTAPLTVYAQDSNLQIYQGVGKAYEFGATFGNTTTASRIWNGTIHYDLGGPCDDPPTPGIAASTASTVCSGASSFTLSLTGSSSGVGQTYQWQSSPDNATWSDISGATNPNYATTQTATTYYRCAVTCGSTEYSASVLVTSGVAVGGTAAASVNPVCNGANFTLSLSGTSTSPGQTYQWQSSLDNTTWADIGGATASTLITNQAAATYYRCNVTCGTTDASASVFVTMNTNFSACYCASGATSTVDEEIYSVTVNGVTNAYDCLTTAPGPGSVLNRYSNFTTLGALTSITQGEIIPFTVQEDECDGATYYAFGTSIWIDYNQNGLFTDPDEQVFVTPTTTTGPYNVVGTFTVPMTATTGITGMRVTVAEGYSGTGLTPCLSYGYGETEDYLIDIAASGACDDPPTPGTANSSLTSLCPGVSFNLSLTGNSIGAGQTYQWQSSPDNATWTDISGATNPNYTTTQTATTYYRCALTCGSTSNSASVLVTTEPAVGGTTASSSNPVCPGTDFTLSLTGASAVTGQTYQWQSSADNTTWTDITGATSATYIAQQTSATYYRCNVTCGTTDASASVYVTMETNTLNCYCTPTYTSLCSSADFIDNFTLETISNLASGCNGNADNYILYPSGTYTATLTPGATYPISMQSGASWGQGFGVWIDFNQNGSFAEADEFVYASPSSATTLFTGTIAIPLTALTGDTRLRVRCKYGSTVTSPESCSNFSYGETEDYIVTIGTSGPFDDASVSPLSIAYNRIGSCATCFDVEATVTNSGNTNTAFDVLASIAGTSYSQTISGVLLAPGASTLLSFPDFDPTGVATGSYTLTVTAQMTGDANPSNDAKSFTFDVTTEDFGYDDGTAEQGLGFGTATGILVNGFTFCENRILEDIVVWVTTNVGDPATEQFAISLWNADGVAGEPGTLLQTVVSPITYNAAGVTLGGWNTFTLSTPLAITAGTMIYVGVEQSTASVTGTWPLGNDQSRPLSGALADISWNAALGGGIGAWSNTAAAGINFLTMIRVNACGSACPSSQDPVAITSIQKSGNDVVLIWGASTGATSYNVYWDTIPGGTTNSQTVGNVLTWTDVGASSLTNRFYTVTATCAAPVASPNSKGTASVSVVAPKSNAQKVTLSTSNSSRKKLQR